MSYMKEFLETTSEELGRKGQVTPLVLRVATNKLHSLKLMQELKQLETTTKAKTGGM